MKTAINKFSERLDEIFEQGNPTKAQIIDAFIKASQFNRDATKEQIIEAINAEPELPEDMPEVIYEAIKNNKDALTELLRLSVRLTKQGIIDRIESQQEDKISNNDIIESARNEYDLDENDKIRAYIKGAINYRDGKITPQK